MPYNISKNYSSCRLYLLSQYFLFICVWLFCCSVSCVICFCRAGSAALVVDQNQAVKFALDVASGMAFLHTLEPMVARLYLNSKHIMVRSSFWLPVTARGWTVQVKWTQEALVAVTTDNVDDTMMCT